MTWIRTTCEVSSGNGYIRVDNTNIKSTSCIFVQIIRPIGNDTNWEKLMAYPKPQDGSCVIYLRHPTTGVSAISGSVNVCLLILN